MNTTIECPFTLSETDKDYINDKIDGLSKYEGRITQVNVYFKKDDGKVPGGILSEIRIMVPGSDVFAEDVKEKAITAFNGAFAAVKRQLKKRRNQLNDHRSEIKVINDIVNNNF
jgi:ribosomal subunit interface protein